MLCSYIYLLMYAVCHSSSSTLYQADNFLFSTRRLKMSVPRQNAPDLREEGSSSTGSDCFHSLVQKAVADSMASVTMQISTPASATLRSSSRRKILRQLRQPLNVRSALVLFSRAKEMSRSLSMPNLFWTSSRVRRMR